MEPQDRILVFLAEFDFQFDQIKAICDRLQEKAARTGKQPADEEAVESTGYWLHNLYNAFEDLFKLVTGFWENSLNTDGEFHTRLLKRMLLSIEDVRPPLLSETVYQVLNELRGFRHVFRHAYSYGLDEERVGALLQKVLSNKDAVFQDLQTFRNTVAGYVEE